MASGNRLDGSQYGNAPLAAQTQDPLSLGEYMGDPRSPRISSLRANNQSPSLSSANGSNIMSSFQDFPSPFSNSPRAYQPFSNSYDRTQLPSPKSAQAPFPSNQRSSVGDQRDILRHDPSGHFHRQSIGSNSDLQRGMDDGCTERGEGPTSPDSVQAMSATDIKSNFDGTPTHPFDPVKDRGNNNGDSSSNREKQDDNKDTPAWAEMKTKAGKDRKRLPLACIACRRKKIRCSGEKPACKHCLRSRIPCVYKVTTRKAAPRTDYMAMLDKRLKRMEDRVIKLIPKENQESASSIGRAIVKPALPGPPPKTPTSKKRPAEEAFGAELDEWAKKKATASGVATPAPPAKEKGQEEENKMLTDGADSLPSKEIQEHLAEVYFDNVYGQTYVLLHKPSYMRKLSQGTLPPVLILAVCAISARFSNHPQLRTEPAFLRGDNWGSVARDIALRWYDRPNITVLIVYVILGLHEFGTCHGGRSWMLAGMALRMAYALQLHRELDEPSPSEKEKGSKAVLTPTDAEIRRRVMWSCFLMDRFNSSGTDRPMFVNEAYIHTRLPVNEHFFEMEITGPTENLHGEIPVSNVSDNGQTSDPKENMGVTAYLIRLVAIWGHLVKYYNFGGKSADPHPMWAPESTYHTIKKETIQFRESLPARLHYTADNLQDHITRKTANHFLMLHLSFHQIILFLNRFALPSAGRQAGTVTADMPKEFVKEAAQTALESANQISLLLNQSMDHAVTAPFVGYCAFFSSTVHVCGIFSKNPRIEQMSKKYLAYNVKYLSKMKKYWGMFHYVAENLKELYRFHADAAIRGAAAGSPKGKASVIFQYGDWFDRYPHGVSRTDYEDPAAKVKKEPGDDAVLGEKSDLQSVEEFFASLSPPSRLHQRKMQKKSKQSKAAGKDQPTPANNSNHNVQQPNEQQINHIQIPQDPNNAIDPSFNHTLYDPTAATPQSAHSQTFPPTDFPPAFAGLPPQLQGMSHLDRQMVLNSYATMDPSLRLNPADPNSATSVTGLPDPANHVWNLDFMGSGGGMGGDGGLLNDPGTAWFMPFNMDPPDIGNDASLFGAGGGGFGLDFWSADVGAAAGQVGDEMRGMDGRVEGAGGNTSGAGGGMG